MITKRNLLITGASSAVVLGIGTSGCASGDGGLEATEPWRVIGKSFGDARLDVLSYAILSPSPHNRQPWLIKLDDDGVSFMLLPDTERLLPQTDPENRQIVIGLGAFLEVMTLAAESAGYDATVNLFPAGVNEKQLDARPIATVQLSKRAASSTSVLFEQIPTRRTDRTPFDLNRPVLETDLLELRQAKKNDANLIGFVTAQEDVRELRVLCYEAWKIETQTPRTHRESVDLTRIGAREINENPDGISIKGGMTGLWKALGVLNKKNLLNPSSRAAKGSFSFYADAINSAMGFAWLATPDNSRLSQVSAGADWVRLHLAANKAGLAFHPLSQALQEFPEMTAMLEAVHDKLGVKDPNRLQGLFRLGYSKTQPPSPRWPLMTRVVQG